MHENDRLGDVFVFWVCTMAIAFVVGMSIGSAVKQAQRRDCHPTNAAGGRLTATWLDSEGQPFRCTYGPAPVNRHGYVSTRGGA